jgi:ribose transport system substrate-binding protein
MPNPMRPFPSAKTAAFALCLLASAALLPSGCNRTGGATSGSKTTIAVIPKAQVNVFWQSVRLGAEAAGKEAGVEIVWAAPQVETDYAGQATIIEDFVNRKVSAVVLAPTHQKAIVPAAEKVTAAGIPLVVMDSGLDYDKRVSYVATDNTLGGVLAARKLGELLGGKGKVAVVGIAPGSGSGLEREGGFQDTIKKEFPGIEMIGLQYCDSDRAKALAVAEDFLTRAPDLAGMFASNESSAVGVFRAIEGRGRKGQIKVVGFDASPDLLDAMRAGTIDALVVQNPFRIGYDGVKAAVAAIRGQPVEKRIDTGVVVVTRDNMESPEVKKVLGP